jgi:hypothetical protein
MMLQLCSPIDLATLTLLVWQVLRHAARELRERLSNGVKLGVFVSFPSPHFGLTDTHFARLAWFRRLAVSWLPWDCFKELRLLDSGGRGGEPILIDLAKDVETLGAFSVRVALGSPHDGTVPFDEATLLAWPSSFDHSVVPPFDPKRESIIVAEKDGVACEPHVSEPVRTMARGLQSVAWKLVMVSGEHVGVSRSWSSEAVIQYVINHYCFPREEGKRGRN